jgi:pimeloyl-ACP methyl ester carboxylesterase
VGSALGSPQSLTPKGDAFASAVEQLTGGPRPFFKEGFVVNYTLNFGLLVQAVAQPQISNAVAQNAGTTYAIGEGYGVTADALNRAVTRVQSNPAYMDRATYPENADLTGKIERPFLTIHGTGDLFVPISMEQSYRRKVDAAGAGDLLVQRAIRRAGHCVYSQDERIAAFDDLVSWVRDGKKPAGEDLLGDLSDAGRAFTKPLLDGDPGGEAIR